MTTFVLHNRHYYYAILNVDADFIVARVYPLSGQQGQYEVSSCFRPSYHGSDVGIVKSLDDAIPAFIDYYKRNPVPWEQESPALYWRHTISVSLRVEQDRQGHWLAYRDDYPMLQDTTPARFASRADAQRAADAHELDLFPNAKELDDGYSWLPDPEIEERSLPYRVEERENWQVSASGFLP
jgi:hypothetical protein